MGQKVHPRGFRLGYLFDTDSVWFDGQKPSYAKSVKLDEVIRRYFADKHKNAMISNVRIFRKSGDKLHIHLYVGRTGIILGKSGQNIEQIRKDLLVLTGVPHIHIQVAAVENADLDATLVAYGVGEQLKRRMAHRRVLKQVIQKAMRAGALGVKVMISGRLGGAEIARTEWLKEGSIPLHTFRANIAYASVEALTVYGIIGIKVWVYSKTPLPYAFNAAPLQAGAAQAQQPGGGRPAPRRPAGAGGADKRRRAS